MNATWHPYCRACATLVLSRALTTQLPIVFCLWVWFWIKTVTVQYECQEATDSVSHWIISSIVCHQYKSTVSEYFPFIEMLRVKWVVVVFITFNCEIWVAFSGLWLLIAKCVENVEKFHDTLLFTIETYTTIGFGYRNVGRDCPHATILLMVQLYARLYSTVFWQGYCLLL